MLSTGLQCISFGGCCYQGPSLRGLGRGKPKDPMRIMFLHVVGRGKPKDPKMLCSFLPCTCQSGGSRGRHAKRWFCHLHLCCGSHPGLQGSRGVYRALFVSVALPGSGRLDYDSVHRCGRGFGVHRGKAASGYGRRLHAGLPPCEFASSTTEGPGYRLHAPGLPLCPTRAAVPSVRCPGAASADAVWRREGKERRLRSGGIVEGWGACVPPLGPTGACGAARAWRRRPLVSCSTSPVLFCHGVARGLSRPCSWRSSLPTATPWSLCSPFLCSCFFSSYQWLSWDQAGSDAMLYCAMTESLKTAAAGWRLDMEGIYILARFCSACDASQFVSDSASPRTRTATGLDSLALAVALLTGLHSRVCQGSVQVCLPTGLQCRAGGTCFGHSMFRVRRPGSLPCSTFGSLFCFRPRTGVNAVWPAATRRGIAAFGRRGCFCMFGDGTMSAPYCRLRGCAVVFCCGAADHACLRGASASLPVLFG